MKVRLEIECEMDMMGPAQYDEKVVRQWIQSKLNRIRDTAFLGAKAWKVLSMGAVARVPLQPEPVEVPTRPITVAWNGEEWLDGK